MQSRTTIQTLTLPKRGVSSTPLPDIFRNGLCHVAGKGAALPDSTRVGISFDRQVDGAYEFFADCGTVESRRAVILADVLEKGVSHVFDLPDRLHVAHTVATSFLQYYRTPWLAGAELTLSKNTYLPVDRDDKSLLHQKLFLKSHFKPDQEQTHEDAFVALGILLLELLSNEVIEQRPRWKLLSAVSSPAVNLESLRKDVAMDWCKVARFKVGDDYTSAIAWCLCRATVVDSNWAVDFVQEVIRPLKKCCDKFAIDD